MATKKLTEKQTFFLMGAWDEHRRDGNVKRKCPICKKKLTVTDLDNGAYRVTCTTPDCVDKAFRGL